MGLFGVRFMRRLRKRLKVEVVQFASGLPRRNCTKIKKRPKKNIKAMGVKKEAGRRSEVPFSRREEGRELGEEKERKRKKGKERDLIKYLWESL